MTKQSNYMTLLGQIQTMQPMHPRWSAQWASQWSLHTVTDSPRQRNSYDCGIFTMVTGALLSRGCTIDRNSYTQNDLYYYNMRQRLSFLLWDHGRVQPGHITNWLTDATTSPTKPPTSTVRQPSTPTKVRLNDTPPSTQPQPSAAVPRTGHLPVTIDSPRRSPRKRNPPPLVVTPAAATTKRKKNTTLPQSPPPRPCNSATPPAPKRSAKSLATAFSQSTGVPRCFYPKPTHKRKKQLYAIFDSHKRSKR
jgi:hypothetical protein